MSDSIKKAIQTVQEVFAEYPALRSVKRVDYIEALELTTVSEGIEGIQLVKAESCSMKRV